MMRDQWIVTLERELNQIEPSVELARHEKHCIHRVPKILRKLNKDAYTPQLISFGPYHHGADHLRPMEHQKFLFLSKYLRRARRTLREVVEAMRPDVRDLMDCYDSLEEKWTNENKFLKLMILDGCFFLYLMIGQQTVELWRPYMTNIVWMDMLRLENQLPLAVLDILMEVGGDKDADNEEFIKYYLKSTPVRRPESIRGMGLHHLDIYRKNVTANGEYSYDSYSSVRPATELHQTGVRFVRSGQSSGSSFKDISFDDNGILRLPYLKFDSNTEPLLLNYLAYEQIMNVDNGVTSYAFLMDNLINSAKDVTLLREKGIIEGWVGSDDDIASLFNHLTKARTFPWGASAESVNKRLNKYGNKWWPKWRASFIQTYLSNPWVFISLGGAFLLLILTVTQTVYTILPYYNKS